MNQIFVPDKTLFPFQFYPVQSHRLEPSFLCRKRNQLNKVNKKQINDTVQEVFLTYNWAAFLWSLGHRPGSISTGRCVILSLGTSETTVWAENHNY